jgi:hypothetical protein
MEAKNNFGDLEKLFPNSEQRVVVIEFVERMAGVDGVEEMLTLPLNGPRRVFIIVREDAKANVIRAANLGRDSSSVLLLGSTPVCTREEFENIWVSSFGGPENVVPVWQIPKSSG